MFATLDPTVRPLVLPSRRRVLVSDTVGFIRNLPTTLVKAFRATLEEVTEAALVLHVVDVSSPSAAEHIAHVRKVLAWRLARPRFPQLLVMNKIDRLPAGEADPLLLEHRLSQDSGNAGPRAVAVSAMFGAGTHDLLRAIDAALPLDPIIRTSLRVPARATVPRWPFCISSAWCWKRGTTGSSARCWRTSRSPWTEG